MLPANLLEPSVPELTRAPSNALPDWLPPFEAAEVPRTQPVQRAHLVERVGWSLAALLVVFWGIELWPGSLIIGWINPVAIGLILAGLLLGVRVWVAARGLRRLEQLVAVGLLTTGLGVWGYLRVAIDPTYGTDAVAFGQYAAELFRDGLNPYLHSMLPALERFLVPAIYQTYHLDGTPVTNVSYPALAFLLYQPALALGLHMQAAIFTNLAFWAAAFVLLWRLLPRRLAWSAGLLMSLSMYASFVVGGVTDALFMPFVLVAVWRWDRYGDPSESGLSRWIGPLALGVACSVKQSPWFLVPFLLLGIAREARARGASACWQVARYAFVALATFVALNEPFIVASPGDWARAVLEPLISPTVPSGQGLINLALFEHVGGVLVYYKFAGVLALLGALLAFWLYYHRLKRAWVPLLALVFFWPSRSFVSYMIDLAPVALLAGVTVRSAVRRARSRERLRASLVGLVGAAFAGSLVLALTARPPLALAIVSTQSTGQLETIDGIEVDVTNRSDRALRPHFAVVKGGYLTTFWYPLPGPETPVIPAHATRRLFLRAPNADSMPPLRGGFVLEGFTAAPATVSASTVTPPTRWRLVLLPNAVNRPVSVERRLVLTVALIDRLGNRVRRAGVRLVLGQVVYAQQGLVPGLASINGQPEGQTPVTTWTNARGEAVFVVRGVQAQRDPVFFQAWIASADGPPHGYSNRLSVQFTGERR